MRFSRLSDYAVALMTHIARHPHQVHTAANVAAEMRVPVPTVAKLMAKLRRNGLLVSTRGVKGGYALVRPAASISVAEIIAVLDGPIALTTCIHGSCEIEEICPSRLGLHRVNLLIRKALDEISLADIATPLLVPAAATAATDSEPTHTYNALPA